MATIQDKAINLLQSLSPNPEKAGNTLLILNALGMVFAAISNTVAAGIDKNTSQEDKKFLIPAGIVTGFANIGLYFAMTKKIMAGLEKAAGSVVSKMSQDELSNKAKDFAKRVIEKKSKALFKKPELLESMKQNLFNGGKIENGITEAAKNLYKDNVKAAASVAGAFIGAVIGCSILTPLIRDIGAYFIQKKMEKNNPKLAEKPYRPYYDPSRVGTGIYNRKQPLSMTSFMAFTNSGMNGRMKV